MKTGGHMWGQRRVGSGISIRQLSAESGVAKGNLSMIENGRLIPTGDEYARVTAALDRLEDGRSMAAAGDGVPVQEPAASTT